MGTYTANYQLYMPSIGEQGWGDLMNGNLTTIDTTMKGLNTRIGTLETETDAVEERVTELENGDVSGSRIKMPTLSYDGYFSMPVNAFAGNNSGGSSLTIIYSSPFPISGKVSIKVNSSYVYGKLYILGVNGLTTDNLTNTQKEYTVTNAYTIWCREVSDGATLTIGIPKLVYD